MIWGKFESQKLKPEDWRKWFAWRPVMLDDGRWCWLEYVQKRTTSDGWDAINEYIPCTRR